MKKQLLSFVALLCVVWLTPARALAYDFVVDGIYYSITSSSYPRTVEVANYRYAGAITIPETVTYNNETYSVTSLGEYAFDGCTGLTSIEIPASVASIGDYAFDGCTGLTSIEIPASVTSIGEYVFLGCSGLTSIEIPASVTAIGEYAFMNCTGLTSIEIPASVTSIGDYAFYCCTGLNKVISHATVPPTCDTTNIWFNVNKSTCTLYVPAGTKDAYAAAEGWRYFSVIEEFDTTDITALDAEATDTDLSDCEIYTAGGQRVDALQAGANIVRMKNGKVKKIVKR